jgi:hypothetical protein
MNSLCGRARTETHRAAEHVAHSPQTVAVPVPFATGTCSKSA